MTLPLPYPQPEDSDENRDNFDTLAQQYPIQDLNLASPNNATYKRLQDAYAGTGSLTNGTTYGFANGSTGVYVSGANTTTPITAISLVAADWAVTGKATKLRIRAQVACNATAPTSTFTFGLYPLTVAGGAGVLAPTLGAVVAGSTVAIAAPSASAVTPGVGTDVAFPADGAYALGMLVTTNQAVNSYCNFVVALDMRNT